MDVSNWREAPWLIKACVCPQTCPLNFLDSWSLVQNSKRNVFQWFPCQLAIKDNLRFWEVFAITGKVLPLRSVHTVGKWLLFVFIWLSNSTLLWMAEKGLHGCGMIWPGPGTELVLGRDWFNLNLGIRQRFNSNFDHAASCWQVVPPLFLFVNITYGKNDILAKISKEENSNFTL